MRHIISADKLAISAQKKKKKENTFTPVLVGVLKIDMDVFLKGEQIEEEIENERNNKLKF